MVWNQGQTVMHSYPPGYLAPHCALSRPQTTPLSAQSLAGRRIVRSAGPRATPSAHNQPSARGSSRGH